MMTAQAVQLYSIGLLAYAAVKIIVPVFYALDDTRWPVMASFAAVAANICIIILTLDPLQHRAIALSTSVTMIMNFLLLAAVLYRKLSGYNVTSLALSLLKITAASALMGLTVWQVCIMVPAGNSIFSRLVQIAAGIMTGALVYGVLVLLLQLREAVAPLQALLHKFRKGS